MLASVMLQSGLRGVGSFTNKNQKPKTKNQKPKTKNQKPKP